MAAVRSQHRHPRTESRARASGSGPRPRTGQPSARLRRGRRRRVAGGGPPPPPPDARALTGQRGRRGVRQRSASPADRGLAATGAVGTRSGGEDSAKGDRGPAFGPGWGSATQQGRGCRAGRESAGGTAPGDDSASPLGLRPPELGSETACLCSVASRREAKSKGVRRSRTHDHPDGRNREIATQRSEHSPHSTPGRRHGVSSCGPQGPTRLLHPSPLVPRADIEREWSLAPAAARRIPPPSPAEPRLRGRPARAATSPPMAVSAVHGDLWVGPMVVLVGCAAWRPHPRVPRPIG